MSDWISVDTPPKNGEDIIIAYRYNLDPDDLKTEFGTYSNGTYLTKYLDDLTDKAVYWMPKPTVSKGD